MIKRFLISKLIRLEVKNFDFKSGWFKKNVIQQFEYVDKIKIKTYNTVVFVKKTQKTPKGILKLAKKRFKEA